MAEKKNKRVNILYLFLLVVYLGVAVTALILAYYSKSALLEKDDIIGALILLSSLPHIVIFFLRGDFKNKRLIPYFVFGIAGIAFGLTTIIIEDIRLDTVCAIWGAFDICRSLYELFDVVPELKDRKWLKAVEVVVSSAEIAIGILLIIHRFEGITLHVKFLGFSFIVLLLNEIMILYAGKRHEKGSDRN